MAARRITKRIVTASQSGARDAFTWDVDLRGFGLKVTPAGQRVFIVQYRPRTGGTTQRVTLGSYPELSVEVARDRARRLLARVAQGENPAAERRERRAAMTVAAIGDLFLEDVAAHRKPRTAAEYRRLWLKHVLPSLGRVKVADVEPSDVRRLHRRLQPTPYLANRVVALLGSAFTFAEREHARARGTNPAREVTPFPERSRERFLSSAEVARLGKALTAAERDGLPPAPSKRRPAPRAATAKHRPKTAGVPIPANPYAVAAIRLLLLTGCRESEVLSLRWNAVDVERGFLRLADTKTGQSVRPLGAAAAALLDALPRLARSPFVFPGAVAGEHLKEISRVWYAVRHAAGLDDVRLHDLRHSFASVSAIGGDSLLLTRTLLGHRDVKTTQKYSHLGDDPAKAAADRASGTLDAWLAGTETPITPLRSARS